MIQLEKLGQIFDIVSDGNDDWIVEQAQNPCALVLEDSVRIFFNTRSKKDDFGNSKSQIAYVDFEKDNWSKKIHVSDKPVLELGSIGSFDEYGTMIGGIGIFKNLIHMYYVGWTRKLSVPYNWEIGLAIGDGDEFKKIGRGPVISSTVKEPFLHAGCTSIFAHEGKYIMFYTSGIDWVKSENGKMESFYQIMIALSDDGIEWKRNGIPIISSIYNNEAQASPTVIFYNGFWHMLFSYRHSTNFRNAERGYRIGYARSKNLLDWDRINESEPIEPSKTGWDSEMVCYPSFFEMNNQIFLLYCGNDFGKNGFGLAKLRM